MKRAISTGSTAAVLFLMAVSSPSSAGEELSLKAIVQKNIEASGGRDKLSEIQNLSFRSGDTKFVVSASGDVKRSTGRDPVISEVILVKDGRVQRNFHNTITDISNPEKTIHLTWAKLCAGLFSLVKFEEELKLEGLKSFGPERLYHLKLTAPGPVEVGFFLRPDDFRLKRLVFQAKTSEGDIYESNTDFGPFEAIDGYDLPTSWFSSLVGTRGNLTEVTDIKLNQPLPKDFFSEFGINVGTTEARPGELKGNVLDFNSSYYGLMVITNWRKDDIEKAGLRTGDKLSFSVEGEESEVVFYARPDEVPGRDELAQGARLMMPMPRGGDTYVIRFIAVETDSIASKLRPLVPIEIRIKQETKEE